MIPSRVKRWFKVKELKGSGDHTKHILALWLPEIISMSILYLASQLIDSYFVASLKSTSVYGALGAANQLLHVITKFSEAIPVAAMAIIGRHNGAQAYEKCGRDLGDTFWTTLILGCAQFVLIFFGAAVLFHFMGIPAGISSFGIPFLRMKSLGYLFLFVYSAFVGFMKGIKNTKTPMALYITGIATFILFDYLLIFGKFGFPRLGLMGSAIASVVQYGLMTLLAIWYVITTPEYKKYFSRIFIVFFNIRNALRLLNLSWPIMIDKGSLAISYVWLLKQVAPLGEEAIASFDIIKNLERFALLPGIAFAQIIVFLVSNKLGEDDAEGAKTNIKKTLILSAVMVGVVLTFMCYKSNFFVSFFAPSQAVLDMAAPAFILVSFLVGFDFIQLILAGALRGAGDVRSVMWTRFFACLFFATPVAYLFAKAPITNPMLKLALVYSTFYLNTGVMGLIFLLRIIGEKWQRIKV